MLHKYNAAKLFSAVLLNIVILLFFYCRSFELISMISVNTLHRLMVIVVLFSSFSLLVFPPVMLSGTAKRVGLIVMVLFSLKHEMDESLREKPNIFPFPRDLRQSISIVTDADSDIGLSISSLLYQQGSEVIITCAILTACEKVMGEIMTAKSHDDKISNSNHGNIVVMQMVTTDLNSVYEFTQNIKSTYEYINYLVLNSGVSSIDINGTTSQGYELYFTKMHLVNNAICKWLFPLLLYDPASSTIYANDGACVDAKVCRISTAGSSHDDEFTESTPGLGLTGSSESRIVIVGSQLYIHGTFHVSLFSKNETLVNRDLLQMNAAGDDVDAMNEARARLANIFFVNELQTRFDRYIYLARHHQTSAPLLSIFNDTNNFEDPISVHAMAVDGSRPVRRVIATFVNPGEIFASRNRNTFLATFSSYLYRSSQQASYLVLYALCSSNILPGSLLDSQKRSVDLMHYRSQQLDTHLAAFPVARYLPSMFSFFSLDEYYFSKRMRFISNHNDVTTSDHGRYDADVVSKRLWHVSNRIISQFEEKFP